MRGAVTLSLATATSLLSVTSNALNLEKRSVPAVVEFDIERKHVSNPIERDNARRRKRQEDNIVVQQLDNEKTLYFCNVTLGTPPQTLRTHIDTGSSDLWVNVPDSEICQNRDDPCSEGGTYHSDESSTHDVVSQDFNISYVDGSYARGNYVTDALRIGGVTLEDFQFGTGIESTSPQGVLGIGYPSNEMQVVRNGKKPYPNLPQALVDNGFIKSNAYSLWLNDLSSNKGQIMFGGVNTAKYEGKLETLPIVPRTNGDFGELALSMSGISFESSGDSEDVGESTFPFPALLDTGSSLTYLPRRVASDIYSLVDGIYDPRNGAGFVPCDLMNSDAQFVFAFSGVPIAVDMNELVIEPRDMVTGGTPRFNDGTRACIFGIAPTTDHIPILGDTVLRSAYVVYDLDNNEISLAQTNFNSTESEIIEIGSGKNSVPDATGVSTPESTAEITGSSDPYNGGFPTGTNDAIPTTTSEAGAAATLRPEIPLGVFAGLSGAGLVFAAM